MSHEAGLDDWMRAVADQLATDGFIAVAPDILAGRGPNGGNCDSFRFPADVIRANERLPQEEAMRRYRAALHYARKLPRASAKIASLGVGMGGADSLRFAAEVSDLNPGATQAFMRSTVEGRNGEAVAAAWPAAIQFLRKHLNGEGDDDETRSHDDAARSRVGDERFVGEPAAGAHDAIGVAICLDG
jgi:carboxymethylenebutenolidase